MNLVRPGFRFSRAETVLLPNPLFRACNSFLPSLRCSFLIYSQDTESPSLSSLVHSALLPSIRLDLLPKASLDIYITILEADSFEEGCGAAGVTAASVALADAGIELYGLVVGAVGVSVVKASFR